MFETMKRMSVCVTIAVAALACGKQVVGFANDEAKSEPGPDAGDAQPDAEPSLAPSFEGPYTDFPKTPVTDLSVSGNPFDGVSGRASGGPCLAEPEIGSMYPRNWLRPRFRWASTSQQNVFELRLHVKNQVNDLVVLTTHDRWTMPRAMWDGLRAHSADQPMTLTIRSGSLSGGKVSNVAQGSSGAIGIAPVDAPGAIVYWTTSNGSVLKGFTVGDETVQPVVTPAQLGTGCIGCHMSTPDGKYVATSASDNANNGLVSYTKLLSVDGQATPPPFVTPSGQALIARQGQFIPTLTKGHWSSGDHTLLSMMMVRGKMELIWTDLEATSTDEGVGWGVLARNGDAHAASGPTWSHDGNTVVYNSTTYVEGTGASDGPLYAVPYNARQGGAATPLAGADGAAYHHYYPTFSPDDQLVAYNRVPTSTSSLNNYNNPQSELFVVPASGGTPARLDANDPPSCSGLSSPGVGNSYAKWSPRVSTADGRSYYFLVFSSTRNKASNGPQLYVTPIVVENGVITSYSALYLWNQPEQEHNHTPAWDVFDIPPIPLPK